jgi:hypothetical protein
MDQPPALRAATSDELAEALGLGLRGDEEAAGGCADSVKDAEVGCMSMDIATDQLIDAEAAGSLDHRP